MEGVTLGRERFNYVTPKVRVFKFTFSGFAQREDIKVCKIKVVENKYK